jgi:hypothetical protein
MQPLLTFRNISLDLHNIFVTLFQPFSGGLYFILMSECDKKEYDNDAPQSLLSLLCSFVNTFRM